MRDKIGSQFWSEMISEEMTCPLNVQEIENVYKRVRVYKLPMAIMIAFVEIEALKKQIEKLIKEEGK